MMIKAKMVYMAHDIPAENFVSMISSAEGRVRELRMSSYLFHGLTTHSWFVAAFDPNPLLKEFTAGLVGTIFGMNISIHLSPDHPRTFDFPDDAVVVFYDDCVVGG